MAPYIDPSRVSDFPVQNLPDGFCLALGKCIATFGFLESALFQAIATLRFTYRVPPEEGRAELERLNADLKRHLSDTLGALIDSFENAARHHPSCRFEPFLFVELRKAKEFRDILAHARWLPAGCPGEFRPEFHRKTKSGELIVSDETFSEIRLCGLQRMVSQLCANVINTSEQNGIRTKDIIGIDSILSRAK